MNNPYTLEPVYGDKFYGRGDLIEEVLNSQHVLIVGIWGMGKTSILKHIEYKLCSTSNVGLYFSVDGVNTPEDFKVRFERACELKYESLRTVGFDAGEMFHEEKNVINIIATLDNKLRSSSKRIFLLVDGAEALAKLDVSFLKELRTSFRPAIHIHLVLAATQEKIYNLRDMWNDWPKSLILSPLTDQESENLIKQSQGNPINVPGEVIKKIQQLTNNHPYLIQRLCHTLFDEKSGCFASSVSDNHLDAVYVDVVRRIMENLYTSLSPKQSQILIHISTNDKISVDELAELMEMPMDKSELESNLNELKLLGYLKEESYSISNYFLKKWLSEGNRRVLERNFEKVGFGLEAYEDLVEELKSCQAIALVGSGCSIPVLKYPSWSELIRGLIKLCERYYEERTLLERWRKSSNYLMVADFCKYSLEAKGVRAYENFLRETFARKEPGYQTEHKLLWQLPFRHYLTTNYDPCLEHAYTALKCHIPDFIVYDEGAFHQFAQKSSEEEDKIIYLHGRYHNPEKIILTESQYQEHYYRNIAYVQNLEILFRRHTVVFIGFGLNDADFVGILRGLTATFKDWNREHYAILSYDKETKNDLANKRDELIRIYHIHPIFYDAPNHDHSSRRYILQCLLEDSINS